LFAFFDVDDIPAFFTTNHEEVPHVGFNLHFSSATTWYFHTLPPFIFYIEIITVKSQEKFSLNTHWFLVIICYLGHLLEAESSQISIRMLCCR